MFQQTPMSHVTIVIQFNLSKTRRPAARTRGSPDAFSIHNTCNDRPGIGRLLIKPDNTRTRLMRSLPACSRAKERILLAISLLYNVICVIPCKQELFMLFHFIGLESAIIIRRLFPPFKWARLSPRWWYSRCYTDIFIRINCDAVTAWMDNWSALNGKLCIFFK